MLINRFHVALGALLVDSASEFSAEDSCCNQQQIINGDVNGNAACCALTLGLGGVIGYKIERYLVNAEAIAFCFYETTLCVLADDLGVLKLFVCHEKTPYLM